MNTGCIALLTDFGLDDIYVGVMKGVMCGLCPRARFIDITHSIAPQNVQQAAIALHDAHTYFPPGTVFLVIVDPGVGSDRRALVAQAGGYSFVAPDNGVLSYTLARLPEVRCVELTTSSHSSVPYISRTFHGRDVFAPAAAQLAAGASLASLGAPLTDIVVLPPPLLTLSAGVVTGEVTHVDGFGNIITSIGHLKWQPAGDNLLLSPRFGTSSPVTIQAQRAVVKVGDQVIVGIQATYSAVRPGDIMALVSSAGWLELAVNQGSAAARLNIARGDQVRLTTSSEG